MESQLLGNQGDKAILSTPRVHPASVRVTITTAEVRVKAFLSDLSARHSCCLTNNAGGNKELSLGFEKRTVTNARAQEQGHDQLGTGHPGSTAPCQSLPRFPQKSQCDLPRLPDQSCRDGKQGWTGSEGQGEATLTESHPCSQYSRVGACYRAVKQSQGVQAKSQDRATSPQRSSATATLEALN